MAGLSSSMRAVVVRGFGPSSVLAVETVPLPVPAADEVRVRVHAAGVNPVEAYMRSGRYAVLPALPWTPGNDAAGVVEAVGADAAATHKVGERVYTTGTVSGSYADATIVKAVHARPLPDGLTFQQGACLNVPYYTAYRALIQKAKAVKGETVFVHGASGGVGTATVQLARAYGMHVIGTASSASGLELVRANGAHEVLDHSQPDHMERLKELTGGAGPSVIIEMLANVNLEADLKAAARFGRVVIVGSRGPIQIDPRDILSKELVVVGVMRGWATPAENAEIAAALAAGVDAGYVKPQVGVILPLDEASKAHDLLVPPPGSPAAASAGNVVLVP